MDDKKPAAIYYCPICRDTEAKLFMGKQGAALWFCGRCFHAFWKVTNLLGEEIFIFHSPKIRYWFSENYRLLPDGTAPDLFPF